MDVSLGIVIPAYRLDVDRLVSYVGRLDDHLAPDRIHIELDSPEPDVTDALAALPEPVTVNTESERRGKGAAVTAGFEALESDVLAFVDADGSTPASSVADVLAPLPDGTDLVVGSRRHPDARVTSHQTFVRRRLGDGFGWLARRMLDVALFDYQCGAKALTRETWRDVRLHLSEPGFAWDVELVAVTAALGLDITEVPIEWHDHPDSTVDPAGAVIDFARALLAARHRARRLQDSPLHHAIAARRTEKPALVHRPSSTTDRLQ